MTFTEALEEEGALPRVLTGSEGVCAGKVDVIHRTNVFFSAFLFSFFFKSICNTVPSAWQFAVTWQDGVLTHTQSRINQRGEERHTMKQSR